MLLLLILDRNPLSQDVVDEPLQVYLTGSDDLLEVLELGLKIILACVIADELDGLLVVLGRKLLWAVLDEVFKAKPGLVVLGIKDLLIDLLLDGEPRSKLCTLGTVWCDEVFWLSVVAHEKWSNKGVQTGQWLIRPS